MGSARGSAGFFYEVTSPLLGPAVPQVVVIGARLRPQDFRALMGLPKRTQMVPLAARYRSVCFVTVEIWSLDSRRLHQPHSLRGVGANSGLRYADPHLSLARLRCCTVRRRLPKRCGMAVSTGRARSYMSGSTSSNVLFRVHWLLHCRRTWSLITGEVQNSRDASHGKANWPSHDYAFNACLKFRLFNSSTFAVLRAVGLPCWQVRSGICLWVEPLGRKI
jgi:hypothetical protein